MMAVSGKQLNEAEPVGPTDRQSERLDAASGRRRQALSYAAGDDGTGRRWYVLVLRAGSDFAVDNAMRDEALERWSPMTPCKRGGHGRKVVDCLKRWMPGYLFVNVEWSAWRWQGLSTIDGIVGVIGGPERPNALPDMDFWTFRRRFEDDPEFRRVLQALPAEGDAVRFVAGRFEGVEGVLTALLPRGRATVGARLFGGVVPVSVGLADVERID